MSDADDPALDGWERHQAEQRRGWLRLSYAERLAWLEHTKAFVAAARAGSGPGREDHGAPGQRDEK